MDDGSTDGTWSILEEVAALDPRFKIHRFDENRGRGAARQYILERASGEYLAFLDADDWMFPERLAVESATLDADPSLAAVGAAMVIFDGLDQAVGLAKARVHGEAHAGTAIFDKPRPPHLNFPASMIRMPLAQATGFDPRFLRSQDSDLLIRALLGRRYAVLDQPLYAYRKAAMTLSKTLEGYRFRIRSHWRHVRGFPLTVGKTIAMTAAKMAVYEAAGFLGREQALLNQRYDSIGPAEVRTYEAAQARVRAAGEALWPAR